MEFGAGKGLLQGHTRRQVVHALKSSELPEGFWQSPFKSQVREVGWKVCDQVVHNFLTGWWWGSRVMSWGWTLSVLRLQEAWDSVLSHHGLHIVNIFLLLERGSFLHTTTQEMHIKYYYLGASLVAQLVKNSPAMQDTPVWFMGRFMDWEDPLEKG